MALAWSRRLSEGGEEASEERSLTLKVVIVGVGKRSGVKVEVVEWKDCVKGIERFTFTRILVLR